MWLWWGCLLSKRAESTGALGGGAPPRPASPPRVPHAPRQRGPPRHRPVTFWARVRAPHLAPLPAPLAAPPPPRRLRRRGGARGRRARQRARGGPQARRHTPGVFEFEWSIRISYLYYARQFVFVAFRRLCSRLRPWHGCSPVGRLRVRIGAGHHAPPAHFNRAGAPLPSLPRSSLPPPPPRPAAPRKQVSLIVPGVMKKTIEESSEWRTANEGATVTIQ